MPTYTTPGVYIEEKSSLPPSVAEVPTAIPVFIGYTQRAERMEANDLHMQATRIDSMQEYERLFGGPAAVAFTATFDEATGRATVDPPTLKFILYYAVRMFFSNGGGAAYIVSAGRYPSPLEATSAPARAELEKALNAAGQEDEPTIIVTPEATSLSEEDFKAYVSLVLAQCSRLKDRVAVLDVWGGDKPLTNPALAAARENLAASDLKYGAAYYPFVRSSFNPFVNEAQSNVQVTVTPTGGGGDINRNLGELLSRAPSQTAAYNAVRAELSKHYLVLPPSGAIAGAYAATDANRGVWKAPANIPLVDVLEPAVKVDDEAQGRFNVDATSGKSINVIRSFSGRGTLVWGARTLAGNDNEWRYVPVRRFFNMVEESIKKSTSWAVFEPNDANTWVKVRGMIEAYLNEKWRDGALAGATPKDAFYVQCGLGKTMNSQDVLEGRLIVAVGLAVVRPAEFIVITFTHKLQTS